ncbi:MAG: aldo/keto reductase [Bacteroidota bacterium]|nr:aldo/keto reductase [Bacteroidota bacterium]
MMNVSRIALGTVQFGLNYGVSNVSGKTDSDEVFKILNTAYKFGIHTLDTAIAYGDSEQVIGTISLNEFDIVSKFPTTVKTSKDLRIALQQSLQNLNTPVLYGYLAHNADSLIHHPELWQTLLEFKTEKIVKKIGYSLYLPNQLEQLLALNYLPDIIQVPYSFVDRRFEPHFKHLKSIGCEIHARSAFLQGLFFLNPTSLDSFFEPIKPLLLQFREIFSDNNQIAGFLMNFVLSKVEVDKLIFGVNTEVQLIENISNLQLKASTKHIHWNEYVSDDILMPNKWPAK